MILDLYGCPQTSPLDLAYLCSEVGLKLAILNKDPSKVQKINPVRKTYFGPARVVYCSEYKLLYEYMDSLLESENHYIVILGGSKSLLIENGVTLWGDGETPLSKEVFTYTLSKRPMSKPPRFEKKTRLRDEVTALVQRESLLSKLQSSIYRISEKEARNKAQGICYAYLGGVVKKRIPTGYAFLDSILSSDLALKFCSCIRSVRSGKNIDEVAADAGVDRFELAYILKRVGFDFD